MGANDAPPGQPSVKFRHLVPWFDPNATAAANPTSNRLYRLFEFLETNTRGAGNPRAGRHTGKININAIWDFETFAGLCDGIGGSNHFTSSGDLTNPKDVEKIYLAYMAARSPDPANGTNYVPGPVNVSAAYLKAINPNPPANPYYALNKPILPLATGLSSGSTGTPADNQNPNGRSINDTLLQQAASPATALNPPMRLFEAPGNTATTHPYQRYELLSKIFNNVTTRSNVFAVWITVGFFDYDPNTGQIGAEIGRSEGRHVRHRMFSVIDRSRVRAFTTATTGAINAVAPQQGTQAGSFAYGMQPLQLNVTAPVAGDPYNAQVITNVNTGMNWAISTQGPAGVAQALVQPLVLVYDPGLATEETVVATPVTTPVGMGGQFTTTLQAAFTKNHLKGATVQCFGHPGPWTRYDPRRDIAGVVLHYNIID